MSKLNLTAAAALGATLFAAGAASATTVNWADLTSQTSATHINGTIATGSGPVGVTYDGSIFFSQITGGGTDYWVDGGYTQGVVNRPPGTDIIAISDGGMKTITFDRTVTDVFIAFTSWNSNFASFGVPFTVVSQGCGFWGCGVFDVQPGNTAFFGNGEVHGVLEFKGSFNSISFTDTTELWHGLTIGITDAAPGVPEPASWALMISGFGLAGAALRRRRKVAATA